MREATGTLSSEALRVLAAGAQVHGIDLVARFDLDREVMRDPDARVPVALVVRIWDELPRLVGDDAFGVHLAELAASAPLGLGGQLIVSAPTLGDGLRRMLAFERVFHDVRQSELSIADDRAILRHDPAGMRMPRHAIEFGWAWLVLVARRVTGATIVPRAVSFAHSQTTPELERVFGVRPRFDAEVPELVLHAQDLARASRGCDPALGAILESHALLLHARLPASTDLVEQVKAAIHAEMLTGEIAIEGVARRLALAPRTLQRRLHELGTSHKELLDAVRSEAARIWLADPSVAVAEVAFGLGFAEVSAFHRAFVRWTGVTPGKWRARTSDVAPGDNGTHERG